MYLVFKMYNAHRCTAPTWFNDRNQKLAKKAKKKKHKIIVKNLSYEEIPIPEEVKACAIRDDARSFVL